MPRQHKLGKAQKLLPAAGNALLRQSQSNAKAGQKLLMGTTNTRSAFLSRNHQMTVARSLSLSPEPMNKHPEQDTRSLGQSLLKASSGAKLNLQGVRRQLPTAANQSAAILPPHRVLADHPGWASRNQPPLNQSLHQSSDNILLAIRQQRALKQPKPSSKANGSK